MKKLKLKALELGAKEVLTRNQLKNVLGGDGSGGGSGSGGGPVCYICECSISGQQAVWYGYNADEAFYACGDICGPKCEIPQIYACKGPYE